jgi:RimJ/RimL family protein N-acetyltransferase
MCPTVRGMTRVRLRAVRADDLPTLRAGSAEDDPFQFFGYMATNVLERQFAANGLISDDAGHLVVEDQDALVVGSVGWFAVQHGPASSARALNIGITLLPAHRGRGLGTAAQAAFVEYLFAHTLVERLEAGTDVDNLAEQRALEKAGFQREGIARHAQFRAGQWHDLITYSRLRSDRPD